MQPIVEQPYPEKGNRCETVSAESALHMMGEAAIACAARHAGCKVAMAKADSIEFLRPVSKDSTLDVRAWVAFQGRSSMTVIVEIVPEGHRSRQAAISGRFMMIAVDHAGAPIPIHHSDPKHSEDAVS